MSDPLCPTCQGSGHKTEWHPDAAIKVFRHVPCPDCQPDRKTETFYPNHDYDKHLPAENPADKPRHNQPPETLGEVGNEGAERYKAGDEFRIPEGSGTGTLRLMLMEAAIATAAHAAGIQEGRKQALAEVDEAAAKLKGCTSFWQYIDYEGTGEIDGLALEFEGDGNVAYAPTLTAALLTDKEPEHGE